MKPSRKLLPSPTHGAPDKESTKWKIHLRACCNSNAKSYIRTLLKWTDLTTGCLVYSLDDKNLAACFSSVISLTRYFFSVTISVFCLLQFLGVHFSNECSFAKPQTSNVRKVILQHRASQETIIQWLSYYWFFACFKRNLSRAVVLFENELKEEACNGLVDFIFLFCEFFRDGRYLALCSCISVLRRIFLPQFR